jgi:hypothetical protein
MLVAMSCGRPPAIAADHPNSKQQTGAAVAGNVAWLGAGSVTWRAGVVAAESGSALEGAKLEAELAALLPRAAAARGFVRACLRAKRYQLDKAHTLACNYIAFRERVGWHVPGAVCAAAVAPALRSGFNTLLTARDRYGHVVLTQSMHRFDPANGTLEAHQRSGYYLLHRALQRPGAQTNGIALLLDFRGFGIRLFSRFGRADVARGVAILQDCFPARVAVLYVLHEPRFLKSVFTLLRPFLKADSLSTKFVLVGSEYSRLYEHLPCEAVPEAILAGRPADDAWCALVDSWVAEEAPRLTALTTTIGIPGSPSCSRCVICNLKRSNVRIVSICNHDVPTGLPGPRAVDFVALPHDTHRSCFLERHLTSRVHITMLRRASRVDTRLGRVVPR